MAALFPSAEMYHNGAASTHSFRGVYAATLLFTFHWALVAYVNSAYLAQFVSNEIIGALYALGSLGTIVILFFSAPLLRTFGTRSLAGTLSVIEILALAGLALLPYPLAVVPLFLIHHALSPLMILIIDVLAEQRVGAQESRTGGLRGALLVFGAAGVAFAALIAGLLLNGAGQNFALVYLASALCMTAFWFVLRHTQRVFRDPVYADTDSAGTIRHFWNIRDFRFVFLARFLLQLFYAWMIIYVPLYLASVIGFPWYDIGILLFVALMAFVVFEYPIGRIADRYIGEKEMMAGGFIVLATTTAYLGLLSAPLLIQWMITLFLSRVGASLVEATTESYFFKHTKDADAGVIGFFRITTPAAYLLGALIGTLTLVFASFAHAFLLFGLLMLPGVAFALFLNDTR